MSIPPSFNNGDLVVYPAHGVGKLLSIESLKDSGCDSNVFVISFIKNRMTLRVPMMKAHQAGLRKSLWSRRATEYGEKIVSGALKYIYEVIRDLHRNGSQPPQSYSELQIYQVAMDRLICEIAAIENIDESEASVKVEQILQAA